MAKKDEAYLLFHLFAKKPKTNVWSVHNAETRVSLGIIKWYGAWRKYCFFPLSDTVFCAKCLGEISWFMRVEMEKRKKK